MSTRYAAKRINTDRDINRKDIGQQQAPVATANFSYTIFKQ